jgi:hypothetical protein
MEWDPKTQPNDNSTPGTVPPLLPAIEATVPPPFIADTPEALQSDSVAKVSSLRQPLAVLLNLFLGLFLADGLVALLDDSLILLFGIHFVTGFRGIVALLTLLISILVYLLMGIIPSIPKRVFIPVTLFNPAASLLVIPLLIYFYSHIQQLTWAVSLCQVIYGLSILCWLQGGFWFRRPLVGEKQPGAWVFSWQNFSVFLLVNVFVIIPAVLVYLVFCAALAVGHFSDGFVALRPAGLTVQVRKYVRDDGKTIELVPMSHVGEPEFYRKLSQSFSENSMVLMEGVTDEKNLLTNKISYKRMATSLGLGAQEKEFKPSRVRMVRADVDIEQFATSTVDFLNLVMLVHAKGVNAENVVKLMQYSPPPGFEQQLFQDLLRKRNRRLLEEIHDRLSQSENIIVPWGAAHMPELAEQIQKSGFRLHETHEYVAIRFRSGGRRQTK